VFQVTAKGDPKRVSFLLLFYEDSGSCLWIILWIAGTGFADYVKLITKGGVPAGFMGF
jgi:hypothetical protein